MEVYLLSVICWNAMDEVRRRPYIDDQVRYMNIKNYYLVFSLNFPQVTASADFLHGVFLTSIDEKLKRSVSQKTMRFAICIIKS